MNNLSVSSPCASALVVAHGGVDMEPSRETFESLTLAVDAGRAALVSRRGVLDGAVDGLAVLEADPAFNAGHGSVLTNLGSVETDGAVALGRGRRFAGVAAVPGVRHPAALARRVMDDGTAVLLVGRQALHFGREHGFVEESLVVAAQRTALISDEPRSQFTGRVAPPSETVGLIVVDHAGEVCSASSTGGLRGKLPGRVGDAAVPGAGCWADERFAVLCSGSGEAAMRLGLARRAAEMARNADPQSAAEQAVALATAEGAVTAVLVVDAHERTVGAAHRGASFPIVAALGDEAPTVVASRYVESLSNEYV